MIVCVNRCKGKNNCSKRNIYWIKLIVKGIPGLYLYDFPNLSLSFLEKGAIFPRKGRILFADSSHRIVWLYMLSCFIFHVSPSTWSFQFTLLIHAYKKSVKTKF